MERIGIVMADDHPLYREGLRTMLDAMAEVELIGEATSGEQAIEMAARLQPEIVLMDLNMPGMNGIEATRRIVQTSPHIGVMVVTMFDDDDSVFAAMRAGARGYLLKGTSLTNTRRAILAVASGEAIFSPAIARRMMSYFQGLGPGRPSDAFPELTDREREVLELIAQGANNAEIAQRLYLSPKTVRNHVSNVFSKLQVTDRAQAIIRARGAGMGT